MPHWLIARAPTDQGGPATTALVKVEQGRLGVLSSHEAYLVQFKESKPSSTHKSDSARQLARVDEGEPDEEGFQLVYLWIGARAGKEACEAARAQVCGEQKRAVRRPRKAWGRVKRTISTRALTRRRLSLITTQKLHPFRRKWPTFSLLLFRVRLRTFVRLVVW